MTTYHTRFIIQYTQCRKINPVTKTEILKTYQVVPMEMLGYRATKQMTKLSSYHGYQWCLPSLWVLNKVCPLIQMRNFGWFQVHPWRKYHISSILIIFLLSMVIQMSSIVIIPLLDMKAQVLPALAPIRKCERTPLQCCRRFREWRVYLGRSCRLDVPCSCFIFLFR